MDIPRELREELNALSKDIFGVPSRWQKILKKGSQHVLTKKVTETVPGKEGEEPTTKEVQVPILTPHGAKQIVTKQYSLEEVHELLLGYKVQLEAMRELQKQQQADKKAKELQEKAFKEVQEAGNGSAV